MTKIKVGCTYTTDKGFVLRCLSQSVRTKGESDGKGSWKKEPIYLYDLKVVDGPSKQYRNILIKYHGNCKPVRFNECGDIVDELTNG